MNHNLVALAVRKPRDHSRTHKVAVSEDGAYRLRLLAVLMAAVLPLAAYLVVAGEAARMRLKGQLAGVLGVPKMLKRRKNIQAGGTINATQISNLLTS